MVGPGLQVLAVLEQQEQLTADELRYMHNPGGRLQRGGPGGGGAALQGRISVQLGGVRGRPVAACCWRW